ncbi:KaiC/GvpD/RAD55 family RecA-like ATPase [Halomonas fontilapidosi]|uniref:KaiC/GvpD/RAD55 family RecA-like ATPase n=1 Tax=Halomonas fontilapidosi TaxID=616675 RepID=A0A7W5DHP2_9GAMM|nr:helicase RepA family protein [Halomonas fontilapidosi]MBB3182715.1 KaiC/GvpD/RAD55 family RecA-like ATPase [Halomonas fontilapidosi]
MTASVVPLHPSPAIDAGALGLPRAFLEARFCSGEGQFHSPDAKRNPRALETITGASIVAMLGAPQRVDKAHARWAIFSDYPSRRAEEQRQHGRFYALWADLDNTPPELQDAADRLADRLGATVLAYTSASATKDNPKARLLVPLAATCPGERFEACQRILNDRLKALGITPDRATERANQVCYLPNAGQFYAATVEEDVLAMGGFEWRDTFAAELAAHDKAEAERWEELERRQSEARAKTRERLKTGQVSPIVAYNDAHPLPLVLEAHGYRQHGTRWLSPLSESGTPGVTITKDGTRWHTAHESDLAAGLPEWGDAFDLLKFWEHNGDPGAALRAVGAMMTTEDGRTLTEFNQDRYRESQRAETLEAFDDLGDPEEGAVLEDGRKRQSRAFGFVPVGDLVADLRPVSWLVRGYLEADSLALVYGEPGHGKSFLAIDLAASIATGTPWHGAETNPGAVFYIAGEGHNGLSRRFKAWELHRGASLTVGVPLYASKRAAPLDDKESAAEVLRVVDDLATETGQTPALIVVDTLARCFGGDENSATDIGAFVTNLDALRHRWNATVLVVHHSGKDAARGARGSTALRGAVDAEYRVTKDPSGTVTLEATKMKDADTPGRRAFRLAPVELPLTDDDGNPVWSCAPVPTEARAGAPKRPKGKHPRRVLDILESLASFPDAGESGEGGCRIALEGVRRELDKAGVDRRRVSEALDSLAKLGWIFVEDDGEMVNLLHSP